MLPEKPIVIFGKGATVHADRPYRIICPKIRQVLRKGFHGFLFITLGHGQILVMITYLMPHGHNLPNHFRHIALLDNTEEKSRPDAKFVLKLSYLQGIPCQLIHIMTHHHGFPFKWLRHQLLKGLKPVSCLLEGKKQRLV